MVTTAAAKPADFLPSRIARFNVTRLIGQGGMGAVYEAEQEHPRRTVALKIIKPGLASPELLRRFEQETQALGRLQHPGIAQIYEAGTADTGFGPQPYFAMEYIRGRSLVKYADELKLDTRARLEIMARVCDAVQHAHQRGLIHRDLKPGNILVDESGQPKIVDFGVARLTDHDTQAATQSGAGQLIGTLAYMSPEQVLADPLEIDTRSDVYALGVILYELLAGRLPYNTGNNLPEALSAIREEDPARLSSVDHGYRGDIETIVAKALEKDKSRRYDSAAEMAADIRRYLTDDPIMARPPSVGYQVRKFTRRHKTLVAGIAAVFVVLVAGIAASIWQAARTREERDRAVKAEDTTHRLFKIASANSKLVTKERDRALVAESQAQRDRDAAVAEKQRADAEAATAKALNEFLRRDLLALHNPWAQFGTTRPVRPAQSVVDPSPNMTVRELLDNAEPHIAGTFGTKPLAEADLRATFASAYMSLNALAEAQKQLERIIELWQLAMGSRHPDTLRWISSLGTVLAEQGKFEEAAARWKAVLKEKPYGTTDHTTTASAIVSAYTRSNNFLDAEKFLLGLLEENRGRKDLNDVSAFTPFRLLINLYENWQPRPKYAEAVALLQKTAAEQGSARGVDDNPALHNLHRLALLYAYQSKFHEAEDVLTSLVADSLEAKAVPVARRISMSLLAEVYQKQGKSLEAETVLMKLNGLMGPSPSPQLSAKGVEKPSIAVTAEKYVQAGRDIEAEEIIPEVLAGFRRAVGQNDRSWQAIGGSLVSISLLYASQGKHARAQQLVRDILEPEFSALTEEQAVASLALYSPAVDMFRTWGARDAFEKNEQLLERVLGMQRRFSNAIASPVVFANAMWSLSQVYWDHAKFDLAQGRQQQAQRSYEKADGLIAELLRALRFVAPQEAMMNVSRQAQLRGSMGKHAEAEVLFAEVLAYRRGKPNEAQNMPATLSSLGWVRIHRGKYQEAEVVLREACGNSEAGSEQYYNCDGLLGASLVGQKKFAEAEPLLLAGYEGLIHAPVDERSTTNVAYRLTTSRFFPQDVGEWIVRLYEEWGKPEQAAEWKKQLAAKPRVN